MIIRSRFLTRLVMQCVMAFAMFAFVNSSLALAQSSFPATVQEINGGVEVISYSGADRLLQRGDVISWIATPDSDNQVAVTTANGLNAEAVAKQARDGTIALWVTRGNASPTWVFLKLQAVPKPPSLPWTVRQGNGGVEVVTYNGTDRMLRQGDLISWVATPGVDNQVAVGSASAFEAEAVARKATDGTLALWVQRCTADPDWVIVDLSKSDNASNPRTGGPLTYPPPSSTGMPDSRGKNDGVRGSADDASMLHVLYIYDSEAKNDSFRWGCEFDVYRMDAYLTGSIPGEKFRANTFATSINDGDGLLEAIGTYRETISPNDSLLIYYSGHGSNDANEGHMLDIKPGVKVARSKIRQAMQDTGARLCVLITDCCESGSREPFRSENRIKQLPESTFWNNSICRSLFFRHTGFVDVTSCGPGELAWSIGPTDDNNRFSGKEPKDGGIFDHGGLFTTSLIEILAMHDGELKRKELTDSQGRITWDSIKDRLAEFTESRFQREIFPSFRKQRDRDKNRHQTVTFLSTGQVVGKALPAIGQSVLGIELIDGPNGVVAGKVDSDRTPEWVGIKSGDRLVSVCRDPYSFNSHFWMDSKFSEIGVLASSASQDNLPFGYEPIDITSKSRLLPLITTPSDQQGNHVASGMWIFTVDRGGEQLEVPIRISEEHSIAYKTYSSTGQLN